MSEKKRPDNGFGELITQLNAWNVPNGAIDAVRTSLAEVKGLTEYPAQGRSGTTLAIGHAGLLLARSPLGSFRTPALSPDARPVLAGIRKPSPSLEL